MEITWESIALFASLFVTLTAVQLKAFEWMLKRGFEAYAPQFESIDKRLAKLEGEVSEIRRDYIKRETWLQEVGQLSIKIEMLSQQVASAQSAMLSVAGRFPPGGRDA